VTVAVLFPGQGAASAAMGLALAERFDPARQLLALAGEAAGVDALRLLARGGRALDRTEVLQPVLTAVCLGAWEALKSAGLRPRFVAGHSLGELGAAVAAGALEAPEAIRLAAVRGRLMGEAAAREPGGMLALQTGDWRQVAAALRRGRRAGWIGLAARNAPDEWVLSGAPLALAAAAAGVPGERLRVAGAWHSRAMDPAVDPLERALRERCRRPSAATMVVNRTGRPLGERDELPAILAAQLTHPVRWTATLGYLVGEGVADWVTAGPGKIVRALLRRTAGASARVHGTEDFADFSRTVEALCPPS